MRQRKVPKSYLSSQIDHTQLTTVFNHTFPLPLQLPVLSATEFQECKNKLMYLLTSIKRYAFSGLVAHAAIVEVSQFSAHR